MKYFLQYNYEIEEWYIINNEQWLDNNKGIIATDILQAPQSVDLLSLKFILWEFSENEL